jgi:hypothetical protein
MIYRYTELTAADGANVFADRGIGLPENASKKKGLVVATLAESAHETARRGKSPPLTDEHHRLLETESAIAPEIIAERGYFSALTPDDVPEVFWEYQRRPGLVIPLFSPDRFTVGYQLRADRPRKDSKGKPCKYDNPWKSRAILDVRASRMAPPRRGR